MSGAIVKREFILYVRSLIETDNFFIDPKFVEYFASIAFDNEDFKITLQDVSNLLKQREDHLKRFLSDFTQGRDYKLGNWVRLPGAGRPKRDILLSDRCFRQIALRSRGSRAQDVRSYFILMDRAYRDYMQEALETRLKDEHPEITKRKRQKRKSVPYPDEKGVYAISVRKDSREPAYSEPQKLRIGYTDQINTRFKRHQATLDGEVDIQHWEPHPDHVFLEKCLHTMNKDDQIQGQSEMFDISKEAFDYSLDRCKAHMSQLQEEMSNWKKQKRKNSA